MTTTYNPLEPVWDPTDGDILWDPVTGDAVTVQPSTPYTDPISNRSFTRDDVANAAFYRVQTFTGEVKRDQSRGVNYPGIVFASTTLDVAVAEIVGEGVTPTPGVQSVSNVRFLDYNPNTRALDVVFIILKQSGERISGGANVIGG